MLFLAVPKAYEPGGAVVRGGGQLKVPCSGVQAVAQPRGMFLTTTTLIACPSLQGGGSAVASSTGAKP